MLTKNDLDAIDARIDAKFQKYTNQVLEKLDTVMGELKTIREEQTLITHTQSEHTETLENHETRIASLEKPLTP